MGDIIKSGAVLLRVVEKMSWGKTIVILISIVCCIAVWKLPEIILALK
jgi:hypothetical protein